MNGVVVVDASLVVKWLVIEDDSHIAAALAQSWRSEGIKLLAPYLMVMEVANALHQRVVRGELSVADAALLLEDLLASGIELQDGLHVSGRTFDLSSRLLQGAIYDSHYLALAEPLGCDLWTADERFFRAASASQPAHKVRLLEEFVASQ